MFHSRENGDPEYRLRCSQIPAFAGWLPSDNANNIGDPPAKRIFRHAVSMTVMRKMVNVMRKPPMVEICRSGYNLNDDLRATLKGGMLRDQPISTALWLRKVKL